MYKQANRPFPSFANDELIDYQIIEAIALRIAEEDKKLKEDAEKQEWKNKTAGLRERVGA